MQHGAEDLPRQRLQAVDLDDGRRHEGAMAAFLRQRGLVHRIPGRSHRLDMRQDSVPGLAGDHRPDIGGKPLRIAGRELRQGTAQHGEDAVRHILLQAEHAQRGAALPRAVEGGDQHIAHHLLGQGRGIHHQRVLPAGLGDQRHRRAAGVQALRQLRLDAPRHLGGAGEHHAVDTRIRDQRRAHLAVAGQELQHPGGNSGLVQDGHGLRGDQRRFLRRLGDHRIARGERRRDLPGEDGEREVPGADAEHRPERTMRAVAEVPPHLRAVVAQEVHRLPHLRHGIGEGLPGLPDQQAEQERHPLLQQIGGAGQAGGARLGGLRGPGRGGLRGDVQRAPDRLRRGFHHHADPVAVVGRIQHRAWQALAFHAGQERRGAPVLRRAVPQRRGQPGQLGLVAQVQSEGVRPFRAEEATRKRDMRVGRARRLFRRHLRGGIGGQRLHRHGGILDAVHEGGIGAVLQQAAHEIGEQRLMRADRRVDAAGAVQLSRPDHLLVERLPHAVQALELMVADAETLAGQGVDAGQGLGIVRGELREDGVARLQQLPRAGEVGDIRVPLAREDGEVLQPVDLRALDLAVPVGALHQPDHQPVAGTPREVDHEVQHEGRALLVGLHHEAEAVPSGQRGVEAEGLQDVQREVEPVGLLGIDVQPDVVALRQPGQQGHARQQLRHHPVALRPRIARMQRRELDGDARPLIDPAPRRRLPDRMDRRLVVAVVALRIGGGGRGLAQHVVGIAEALRLHLPGPHQGLGDGLAGDELLAHHPHRQIDALADHRLPAPCDQPCQRVRQPRLAAGGGEAAGDHQPPGGGVHEKRGRVPQMRAPVPAADLVADQRVPRGGVGNAQQRFRQAHQRHAFLRRQRELLHQPFDRTARALAAQRLHQPRGGGGRPCGERGGKRGVRQEAGDAAGLRRALMPGDGGAERALCLDRGGEGIEGDRRGGRHIEAGGERHEVAGSGFGGTIEGVSFSRPNMIR
ncbi:hypothetical protein ROTAS13_02150 [Roseomonas sp. TAS13]|nr:hypothetical protein ROTAS13_02150 [Roseomonas sp. TAS13]